jgi:hypothetical protein
LVTFSASFAQPCRTTAVTWCCGETHEDIVSVVVCAKAGAAVAPTSAASRANVSFFMQFLPGKMDECVGAVV